MGFLLVLGGLIVALTFASIIMPLAGSAAAEYVIPFTLIVLAYAAHQIWKRRRGQPSAMDAIVHLAHGAQRTPQSVDLERAVTLACEDLLQERIPLRDVEAHATVLVRGPMRYSTHDLATATALAFFKSPLSPLLSECHSVARTRVANWAKTGKVNSLLAEAFDTTIRTRSTGNAPIPLTRRRRSMGRQLLARCRPRETIPNRRRRGSARSLV